MQPLVDELAELSRAETASQLDWVQGFTDDAGVCRPTDRFVLAWRLGLDAQACESLGNAASVSSAAGSAQSDPHAHMDRLLWKYLLAVPRPRRAQRSGEGSTGHDAPSTPPQPPLPTRSLLPEPVMSRLVSTTGPLCRELHGQGIESWTEAELASLHALGWLWRVSPTRAQREALAARSRSHRDWLIEEIQPDNATNRPWALAAFIALGREGHVEGDGGERGERGDGELLAHHYAQTLLHNCQVQRGRPDRFSTVLLLDAIVWLEMHEADTG